MDTNIKELLKRVDLFKLGMIFYQRDYKYCSSNEVNPKFNGYAFLFRYLRINKISNKYSTILEDAARAEFITNGKRLKDLADKMNVK